MSNSYLKAIIVLPPPVDFSLSLPEEPSSVADEVWKARKRKYYSISKQMWRARTIFETKQREKRVFRVLCHSAHADTKRNWIFKRFKAQLASSPTGRSCANAKQQIGFNNKYRRSETSMRALSSFCCGLLPDLSRVSLIEFSSEQMRICQKKIVRSFQSSMMTREL